MSASIMYRQVNPEKGQYLGVGSPQQFMRTMESGFGSFPCVLTEESIPILKGMAATVSDEDNVFEEIIELLQQIGSIELWPEY